MSSPVEVLLVQPGRRLWDLDGNSFRQAASWLDLTQRGTPGPAEAAAPNIWTWSHREGVTKSVHTAAAVRQGRKLCIQGWKTQTATSLMGLARREHYLKRLLATTSTTTSPRIHRYKVVHNTTLVAGGKYPSPAWLPHWFRQCSTVESPVALELRIANASFIDTCCTWKVTWCQSVLLQTHERAGDHHLDNALRCGSLVYIKQLNARHWWHKPHFAEA